MNRHRVAALLFLAVAASAILVLEAVYERRRGLTAVTIPVSSNSRKVPPKVVSWHYAAFLLAPDGSVWGWGNNSHSRLLAPKSPNAMWPRPRRLGTNSDWIDLAVTHNAIMLIRRDGTLWGWDSTGTKGSPEAPMPISTNAGWRSIQNGISHVLALRGDGSLWAWGQNNYGQVGDGTTNHAAQPVRIGTDAHWRTLAPGAFHNLGVQSNGTLWYWGRIDPNQPVAMSPPSTLEPAQYGTETDWVTVVSGDYHSAAQKADGSLWLMGPNVPALTRQSNASNAMARIGPVGELRQLAAGGMHLLALRPDGSLWGFGHDQQGALGGTTSAMEFTRLDGRRDWTRVWSGGPASFALAADGTLWTWGTRFGEPNRLNFFQRIESGLSHLAGIFGKRGRGGRSFGGVPRYTATPWPIARFVTNRVAATAETDKTQPVQ